MTTPQILILCILVAVFALFLWGRWRYDLVAFAALMTAVVAGLVDPASAFAGFGHPATVTVAVVLILSRALSNTGAIDALARLVEPALERPSTHIASLSGIGAVMSAFMNNVGALALLMPVAIQSAIKAGRSPALILMPLSFGTILGGLLTLIGTPPNIIIAAYRETALGEPFAMFDFTPVGGIVALAGIVFVALLGWRLIPAARTEGAAPGAMFDIDAYMAQVRVPEGAAAVGKRAREIRAEIGELDVVLAGLNRGKRHWAAIPRSERVKPDDVLVIEAPPGELDKFVTQQGLEIIGATEGKPPLKSEDTGVMEVVVTPRARIEGRRVDRLRLQSRFGVTLLGVSRQGRPYRGRLRDFKLAVGDVLLLHGEVDHLGDVISDLGCLPLAGRDLAFGKRNQAVFSIVLFGVAVALGAFGILKLQIALGIAALGMVLTNIVPARDLYDGVDWPVVVLLGAMIPIGGALESTGTTGLLAGGLLSVGADLPAWVILALVLVVTMTLSDVLNNAATAVVMAPIGATLAQGLGASPDPFLMAVAIGASCAFLTPIGHQNNALVMGPGGYRFSDYWRVGLPLEILITALSVPLILWVWPL